MRSLGHVGSDRGNRKFSCISRCNDYRGNVSNPNGAKGADTMSTATPSEGLTATQFPALI